MTEPKPYTSAETEQAIRAQPSNDPKPEPKRVRLHNGVGPEITVPTWWEAESQPTPGQWLVWFLEQSTAAQLVIAGYHLDIEVRFAAVRNAVEG